jgi:peptide deformylase
VARFFDPIAASSTLLPSATDAPWPRNRLARFVPKLVKIEWHSNPLRPVISSMPTTVAVSKQKLKKPPLQVHQLGDRVLRQPAKRIAKIDDGIRELARQMLQTMYTQDGVGLAAPQVGINKQLIVLDCDPENAEARPLIMINPEIKKLGGALCQEQEGCLSVPGVYMDVMRPETIEVAYKDENGRLQVLKTDGLLARAVQHEIDHLNGVMFVDRVENRLALTQELTKQGFSVQAVKPVV